jgi:hypothetical protein
VRPHFTTNGGAAISAFDILNWGKLIGGATEGRTSSLTGDVSQRLKALIERTLQTTSPGLTGAKAGSLGQQVQYLMDNPPAGNKDGDLRQQVEALVVQLLEAGAANPLAASPTGSLGQQIAQAASLTLLKGFKATGTGPYPLPLAAGAGVAAAMVTVTASTTIWTYGSWTTVAASAPADLYVEAVLLGAPTGSFEAQVQLGVGGAGSEVVVATVPAYWGANATAQLVPLPHAPAVASGQRVAARSLVTAGAPNNYALVKLLCVNQADVAQAI